MQTLKAEPIEHTDVHGKTKFYVKISNDVESYIISVGQRTIDECKRMQAMEPQIEFEFKEPELKKVTLEHATEEFPDKILKPLKGGNKG